MAQTAEQRRVAKREWMRAYRATPEGRTANKRARQKCLLVSEHRDVKRQAHRRWKKSEIGQKYQRDWARENYRWERHITITYNITIEQYHEMAAKGCHICGVAENSAISRTKRLFVDHDHDSGKVRGVLCDPCNRALGLFKDDPERLRNAITYLMGHSNA